MQVTDKIVAQEANHFKVLLFSTYVHFGDCAPGAPALGSAGLAHNSFHSFHVTLNSFLLHSGEIIHCDKHTRILSKTTHTQ